MPYALPIFISACFFSHLALSQLSDDQQKTEKYVCQTDNECLERLSQALLNKKSEESFYQVCRFHHQTAKKCCANPIACSKAYAREASQSLKSASSIYLREKGSAPASCQLNNLSGLISLFLSGQSSICQAGAEHCKSHCEDKLEQFKKDFKACFSIKHPHTIDSALKQAKNPLNSQNCWREMRFIAERYKKQSLNKRALFREDIKAEDIVDCEDMGKKISRKNMSRLALNMCYQAQAKRRSEERTEGQTEEHKERERARLKAIEERERQERQDDWQTSGIEEWEERQEKMRRILETVLGYGSRPKKEEVKSYVRQVASEVPKTKKETEKYGVIEDKDDKETEKYGVIENDKEAIKERKIVKNGEEKELVKQNETAKGKDKKAPVKKEKTAKGKDKKESAKKDATAKGKHKKAPVKRLAQKKTGQNSKQALAGAGLMASSAKGLKSDKPKKLSKIVKAGPAKGLKPDKLKKRASSSKTSASASLTGSQTKPQAKTSASGHRAGGQAKPLSSPAQLAQAGDKSGKCPISMPKIKSAVVYQSVEAPQITALSQQEYQKDLNNPSFSSYDLAKRKPAGILIKLERSDKLRENFKIQINIGNKASLSSCFHEPFKPFNRMIDTQQTNCLVAESDFKNSIIYKFFGLHMGNSPLAVPKKNIPVIIHLASDHHPACKEAKTFKINIKNVHSLDLGWTGLSETECLNKAKKARRGNKKFKGYKFSAPNRFQLVEDFIKSEEVSHYLGAMFPVRKARSTFLENKSSSRILVRGRCDNSLPWKGAYVTKGLLRDTLNLESWRQREQYHKLISIVPMDYFVFHGRHIVTSDTEVKMRDYDGLVINPAWRNYSFFWFQTSRQYYGGSFNIAFVREDAINRGTVAHELGHILGQLRRPEFYEKKAKCRRFRGSRFEPCHNRQIPIGLDTRRENIMTKDGLFKKAYIWDFVKNRYSIMDSEGNIFSRWIDRETHQKAFESLSKTKGGVVPLEQSVSQQIKNLINASISGYYHKKDDSFVVPNVKVYKTTAPDIPLPKIKSQKALFLTFQLKEKNNILQEKKRPVLKMEMKAFYKDGSSKTAPFPASPFLVNLKLPENYKKRKLYIYVLSPKGDVIYSAPIPKNKLWF